MTTSSSEDLKTQIPDSISAMVLLNSSCQGVVETYIDQSVAGSWYSKVQEDLNTVQKLVRTWRLSGNLYFSQSIVSSVIDIGEAFKNSRVINEELFDKLNSNYNDAIKQKLINNIQSLQKPIQGLVTSIKSYNDSLNSWASLVENAHEKLNKTIAEIQNEEAQIEAEIAATNLQIDLMKQQIAAFKKAIAKAKEKRTTGIFETIFGVVLAPFTLGTSLILAGFGVSSIVEAEVEVTALQGDISNAAKKIVAGQAHLTDDQKQVASLQGLLLSVGQVDENCTDITRSLEALQITVGTLYSETANVVEDLNKSTTSQQIIIKKVWYMASCNEWENILDVAKTLICSQPQISRKTI
ncbi:MAG: non-hemolytic enterotoxin lytic component L1 [Magnetococcales bacterium]|nr:non-hemolytic enterotoxin lytic component L1 [Magnetococcales bacterium]